MRAVVTVIGKDTVGILHKVSGICAEFNVNVIEVTQSVLQDMFAMIMLVDISAIKGDFSELVAKNGCSRQGAWSLYPHHARGYLQLNAQYLMKGSPLNA